MLFEADAAKLYAKMFCASIYREQRARREARAARRNRTGHAAIATPNRRGQPSGGGRTANYLRAADAATSGAKGFAVSATKSAGPRGRVSPAHGRDGRTPKGGKQVPGASNGGTRTVGNGANGRIGAPGHVVHGSPAHGGAAAKGRAGGRKTSATRTEQFSSNLEQISSSYASNSEHHGSKLRARGADASPRSSQARPTDNAKRAAQLLSRAPRGGVVLGDSKSRKANSSTLVNGYPADRYIRILRAIPPVGMPPPHGADSTTCELLMRGTDLEGADSLPPVVGATLNLSDSMGLGSEVAETPDANPAAGADAVEARSQLLSA